MRRATLAAMALLALGGPVGGPVAAAQVATPSGTYTGTYRCGQGMTALSLSIRAAQDGSLSALFYFHAAAGNPGVPKGCFDMHGQWDARTGAVSLQAGAWLLRPPNYVTVDLQGHLTKGFLGGTVIGPGCTDFSLQADDSPPAPPAECTSGHRTGGFI
ncbi:MAG TPA: hypothetical protein VJY39_23785 [Acidisphaera sp.]|nr:hypothetical protein [Acidisphaera sp.]